MKTLACLLCLLLLPGAAQADFDLARLVGEWTGSGRYVDGATGGTLRCRMTVAGHAAEVVMVSRCASGAGSGGSTVRVQRQGDGSYVSRVEAATGYAEGGIKALRGRPEPTRLVLRAARGDERATMELRFGAAGQLHLGGEYIDGSLRQASVIDFSRQ